jgi:fibronectin type 3 domain-containing protein
MSWKSSIKNTVDSLFSRKSVRGRKVQRRASFRPAVDSLEERLAPASYSTNFPLTENPISEGGNWINGGTTGLDWGNISTTPGYAIGVSGTAQYSDPTALLTGAWGPDQTAQATVRAGAVTVGPEVELRLRSSLSAHVATGYEITYSVKGSSFGDYAGIARWNGPLASFTSLASWNGPQYSVTTGDVVKATMVGNVITVYKNGVQLGQATDNTFSTGNPGIGFNYLVHGSSTTNGDYGFTSFTASDGVSSIPSAPTGLTATAGNAQVALAWSASAGAASYNVYRSTASGSESVLQSGITATTYTDTTVSNGTTYYYKVAAVNTAGASPLSSEVSATPEPNATSTLTPIANAYTRDGSYASTNFGGASLLQLKNGGTGWDRYIFLEFDISSVSSVSTATLQLYGNINGTSPTNLAVSVYGVSNNTWTENGITWNTQPAIGTTVLASNTVTDSTPRWYAFDLSSYIQAAKAGGSTKASVVLEMTTFDGGAYVQFNSREASSNTPQLVVTSGTVSPPAAPTNLAAAAGNAQVSLGWTASSGATSYNVYRSTTSGAETLLQSGITTTSFTDTEVSNGTTYFYKVAAANAGGTSPLSNEASATPQVPPPAAPSGLTASAGNGQVALAWAASSGAMTYNVYRSATSGGETLLKSGVTTLSFTDTGLTNGTTYFYKVAGVNAGGTSPLSSEASATPQGSGALVTAIDAGGPAAGSFGADIGFSGGSTNSVTNAIDTSGVANPAPQAVYQNWRWGNFGYTIPNLTPGSPYTVRLDFSENIATGPGQKVFNVSINGTQVLTNFDIYATAGGAFKAVAETFGTTANAAGQINLQFTPVVGTAKVNGIEILAGAPELLAGTPLPGSPAHALTQKQLDRVVAEAIRFWAATGLSAAQVSALEHVQFVITNLPGGLLGDTVGNVIYIDSNAAGYGWSLGAVVAPCNVDLLTVVCHELGHELGLSDLDTNANPSDVMDATLAPGMRRLPRTAANGIRWQW